MPTPHCTTCKDRGVLERERYVAYITTGADVPYLAYCDCDAGEDAERRAVLDDPHYEWEG